VNKNKITSNSQSKTTHENLIKISSSEIVKIKTRNKEEQAKEFASILVQGASDQLQYLNNIKNYMDAALDDEDKSFFDI